MAPAAVPCVEAGGLLGHGLGSWMDTDVLEALRARWFGYNKVATPRQQRIKEPAAGAAHTAEQCCNTSSAAAHASASSVVHPVLVGLPPVLGAMTTSENDKLMQAFKDGWFLGRMVSRRAVASGGHSNIEEARQAVEAMADSMLGYVQTASAMAAGVPSSHIPTSQDVELDKLLQHFKQGWFVGCKTTASVSRVRAASAASAGRHEIEVSTDMDADWLLRACKTRWFMHVWPPSTTMPADSSSE